jgi:membrane-associated protein
VFDPASLFDPERLQALIDAGGLWLVAGIVFAETGLLVGFFLPGDSLLFLAGVLCAFGFAGHAPPFDFLPLCTALIAAAVAGNTVNWWLGRLIGNRIEARGGWWLIRAKHLEQAHGFYERWGALSLVLTRWVPVLRTFVPFVAGAARMPFGRYTLWNVVGAVLWVPTLVWAGMALGQVPFIRKHLELIVLAVIAISVAPMVVGAVLRWRRAWRQRAHG